MSCKEVHIVPLRAAHGVIGALVVCAQPRCLSKAPETVHGALAPGAATSLPLADLLQPLEALALRLTMQLAAPEEVTAVLPERSGPRQERHTRSVKARDRQARTPETPARRSLDDTAAPLGAVSTSGALERVRQLLDPAAGPLQSITGVSGRPPARVWR